MDNFTKKYDKAIVSFSIKYMSIAFFPALTVPSNPIIQHIKHVIVYIHTCTFAIRKM
jgi:hypothetical protein